MLDERVGGFVDSIIGLAVAFVGAVFWGESQGHDRAYQGVVQAAAPIVAVAPVIVIAAGVTLAVYLAAVVTEEAIEAVKRRRKTDPVCDPPYYECLGDSLQPGWNIGEFGSKKDCLSCLFECRRFQVWPAYKCPPPGYRPPGSPSK